MFVLLFIFVKRQIMRFAMRSRRGPHAPIGHNATKVKQIIKGAGVIGQCGDTYWTCLSRVWKRTLIPGFPESRKSASNLVSCQRKTIVWSRDHKLVSHLIITITCPSSVVKLLNCLSISKVATTTCTEWRLWTRSGTQVSLLLIGLAYF